MGFTEALFVATINGSSANKLISLYVKKEPRKGSFLMEKGWVKAHRSILENHFLMHDNNAYLVFTKLLLLVGKNKGEWSGGRKQLAELTNISEGTLYNTLQRLEANSIINRKANSRYSVITICNWHKYQARPTDNPTADPTGAQQPTNSPPTAHQHSNKNKNKNKKRISTVKIDQELAAKEKAAMNRKPGSGYKKALSMAEAIKLRRAAAI